MLFALRRFVIFLCCFLWSVSMETSVAKYEGWMFSIRNRFLYRIDLPLHNCSSSFLDCYRHCHHLRLFVVEHVPFECTDQEVYDTPHQHGRRIVSSDVDFSPRCVSSSLNSLQYLPDDPPTIDSDSHMAYRTCANDKSDYYWYTHIVRACITHWSKRRPADTHVCRGKKTPHKHTYARTTGISITYPPFRDWP